jgi:hypothetical protein
MTTAKLADVKMVLFAEVRFHSRRKGTQGAQVAFVMVKNEFKSRATLATWGRLVAASQQLHALVKAERADQERADEARTKPREGGDQR